MSDKDKLADSLERFKLCHDGERENRIDALDDLRFARLGEQWHDKDLQKRRSEGRPALTINRMPTFIRQVVNDARQNKPAIRVRPSDSNADPKTAEIYNGLIRNIEQQSNADVAYDTACDFAVSCGVGYFRIKTDYACDDSFDLDLMIERVANPFTVYGDPYSTAADASDWNMAFVTDELTHEEFERRYPGAEKIDFDGGQFDEKTQLWLTEDTVRIAEEWVREKIKKKIVKLSSGLIIDAQQWEKNRDFLFASGLSVVGERETNGYKVTQRIINGKQVLEDTTDWAGIYIPICPVYGEEVNVEGRRYFRSLIRDAKDAQRMLNYWRTTSTELVALAPKAPWVGPKGFADEDSRWETANTETHPYLEYKGAISPQRQPFAGVPAGALQEAMNASDDLKSIMGLYDASLGARSNETSGRAIMARQREGDTSTFHFIDNLTRGIRYGGQVLIDLIPKVYNQERMVRVLGEDGEPEITAINNGVIDLSRGKYDLVVQSGPSYTSKREEFANVMTEFTRANPAVFPLVADKLVKAMDFPDAETLANRFKTMLPPPIQQMEGQGDPQMALSQAMGQIQQMQAQMQQMQQALQQAQQAAQSKQAEAQAKVAMHVEDAKLDRFMAEQKALLERQQAEYQAAVDRDVAMYKAQLDAQTKVVIARIEAGANAQLEAMRMVSEPPEPPEPTEMLED